ncbi:MAG: hypothetical protein AVDCRST_MAG68-5696 [uncultured Gemmatimonadetes bacterium]|uniref:Uncharacterized protein n=1 Tax=uncultured Gemmatimonadota bacterium TaxID=203437 RepID=A0A6J4MYX5_9BACT|nr:MAG: hypothetical protein AVDCRST_MAG68-5696 [uncultured Gemmatimonadota bacterium]
MHEGDDIPTGLLDRLIRAYRRVLRRPDRPTVPPPPDLEPFVVDTLPTTEQEQATAEAAAREVVRRLRKSDGA